MHSNANDLAYQKALLTVEGLPELIKEMYAKNSEAEKVILMELVLHGLAEYSQLSKHNMVKGFEFKDLMSSMFEMKGRGEEEL